MLSVSVVELPPQYDGPQYDGRLTYSEADASPAAAPE